MLGILLFVIAIFFLYTFICWKIFCDVLRPEKAILLSYEDLVKVIQAGPQQEESFTITKHKFRIEGRYGAIEHEVVLSYIDYLKYMFTFNEIKKQKAQENGDRYLRSVMRDKTWKKKD